MKVLVCCLCEGDTKLVLLDARTIYIVEKLLLYQLEENDCVCQHCVDLLCNFHNFKKTVRKKLKARAGLSLNKSNEETNTERNVPKEPKKRDQPNAVPEVIKQEREYPEKELAEVKEEPVNTSLNCTMCSATFQYTESLTKHLSKRHQTYNCTDCNNYTSTDKRYYMRHIRSHQNLTTHRLCSLCFKMCGNMTELFEHRRVDHKMTAVKSSSKRVQNKPAQEHGKIKKEQLRNKVIRKDKSKVKKRYDKPLSPEQVPCKICGLVYKNLEFLRKHTEQAHPKPAKTSCSNSDINLKGDIQRGKTKSEAVEKKRNESTKLNESSVNCDASNNVDSSVCIKTSKIPSSMEENRLSSRNKESSGKPSGQISEAKTSNLENYSRNIDSWNSGSKDRRWPHNDRDGYRHENANRSSDYSSPRPYLYASKNKPPWQKKQTEYRKPQWNYPTTNNEFQRSHSGRINSGNNNKSFTGNPNAGINISKHVTLTVKNCNNISTETTDTVNNNIDQLAVEVVKAGKVNCGLCSRKYHHPSCQSCKRCFESMSLYIDHVKKTHGK